MSSKKPTAADFAMVDAMVKGGKSLDEVEAYFRSQADSSGILSAVSERRVSAVQQRQVAEPYRPQPTGCDLGGRSEGIEVEPFPGRAFASSAVFAAAASLG